MSYFKNTKRASDICYNGKYIKNSIREWLDHGRGDTVTGWHLQPTSGELAWETGRTPNVAPSGCRRTEVASQSARRKVGASLDGTRHIKCSNTYTEH